jgi:hypothetical protein
MGDFLKPKDPSRADILATVGDTKKFVNPYQFPAVADGWPKPQTERAKDFAKSLSMEMDSLSDKRRL